MILSGKPYHPLGAPAKKSDVSGTMHDLGYRHQVRYTLPDLVRYRFNLTDSALLHLVRQALTQGQSQETIILALKTLSSFDFGGRSCLRLLDDVGPILTTRSPPGHVLNEFVTACALPYLEVDNSVVRQAAASTCCRLFSQDPICYQNSSHSIEIISGVLEKLLTVGIADRGRSKPQPLRSSSAVSDASCGPTDLLVRQTVLKELSEKFDRHLAQAENVRLLFIALNDVLFSNRQLAIKIIGRLAQHNPAYVMPSLRKVLIQMISNLEFATRRSVRLRVPPFRHVLNLTPEPPAAARWRRPPSSSTR